MTGGDHVTQLAGPPKMAVCVAVIAKEVRTRVGCRPCPALAFALALHLPPSLPLGLRRDEAAGFEEPSGSGQFRGGTARTRLCSCGSVIPGSPQTRTSFPAGVAVPPVLLPSQPPTSPFCSTVHSRGPSHRPPGQETQHTVVKMLL